MATDLLAKTYDLFPKTDVELARTYVFACQHILRPRERMLPLLVDFGIPKENIFVLGKAYSTNEKLLAQLQRTGFNVYQRPFDPDASFDAQHRANCNWLFDAYQQRTPRQSRTIVLDDGAMLLSVFMERFAEVDRGKELFGIEQTSSGFRKLEHEDIPFPVINVARSSTKLDKESPFIADVCLRKVSDYFSKRDTRPVRYLVIGLGPIGKACLDQLKRQGKAAAGFDQRTHRNLRKTIATFKPSVIIGATGATSVTERDIGFIDSLGWPTYLVSVSSSDREFSVAAFRKAGAAVHADVRHGNVTFVNNGFPINFEVNRPREGIEWIERTICLMFGSVLFLAGTEQPGLPNGLVPTPRLITDIL